MPTQNEDKYGSTADPASSLAPHASFRRNLGTSEAFSIIINIVIGSGLFTSLGAIDTNVPSPGAALVVWFVGGILAWTVAATMAELGAAIPGEGGVQQYLQYIYSEAFGFLAAIVFVESIYSATGVTDQPDRTANKLISSLVLLVISMANSVSTQFSTRLNTFFLTTKFAAIAVTMVAGLGVVFYHLAGWDRDNSREPQDWLTRAWFGARNTVGLDGREMEWQKLHGWESLGHYSDALYGAYAELSAPARQLPLAIKTAVPLIILSFIAVNIAYYILLFWRVVSTTDSVAVTSFSHLLGPTFGAIAAGLICLVVAGSLLGSSFVAGRIVVAAAYCNWLPARVGSVSGRSTSTADAPINAILFSTAGSIVYIFFGDFRVLAAFSGLCLLRPYKPMICVPVVFALVSRCVVACGAVFAPVQAVVLIGLWLVGLGLYSARRQWIGKGEAESSEQ
ncbi:amino acid transporter [Aspergillus eucalypticola CBS 122712]|uniref:Amino acid transporter n=1 Tax=Aspergillus eucalypticola (strain CBS 122712 / IBT 29274) TaxID=1448314 RepID=A0A317UPE3_ASPEC|nr:amino acid transporter [Aspergillus eucalypticola CBS 122712]PWY61960.1 amino acid transporter [Aspergillus eucalypticola CBS 122712]